MSMQKTLRLSLAGAVALALSGIAGIAAAQAATQQAPPPPPPVTQAQTTPAQDTTQQQATTGQFYQGTESTATYPLPDSHGGTLTVHAGMPEQTQTFGPPPSFATLDANKDGHISETEAQAYPPLDSDFLYASGGGRSISRAQYERWVRNQH